MATGLRVLIVGAGIAGPALAYWLVRQGHQVLIVEKAPELRTGGHAVDVRGTALEVMERMGLAAAVRAHRTRNETLSIVRGRGPRTHDIAVRPLQLMRGDREVAIMRDDLVRILFAAIADDVETVWADSVATISVDGAGPQVVELIGGGAQEVDLVIGADGQHSAVRNLAFGPEQRFLRPLGAYISIFTTDNFLGLTDRAVLYNEPGRAAAMFTVPGNERAKAVLAFRSAHLVSDPDDRPGQTELLRRRFASMGWHTADLLDAIDGAYDFYFDEAAQIRLPTWSTGRMALLGDAAFGPSPLSGQGTSLALTGAYLLAHELGAGAEPATALRRWEQGFRAHVADNQRLAGGGMSTLIPAHRPGIVARNLAMRAAPVMARLGRGFGGDIERASRAVTLPPPIGRS